MGKKQRGKYKVAGYPDSHSELQVEATDCAEELAMFGRRRHSRHIWIQLLSFLTLVHYS
jgi:hypothetical protein